MEYKCIYNPDLDIIEVATHGRADMAALFAMLQCIADLCGQHESAHILVDHSQLDAKNLSWDNIDKLSRNVVFLEDIFQKRKCAHIVLEDYQFGLVRSWEIMVEVKGCTDLETKVFRNRNEAIEWISSIA